MTLKTSERSPNLVIYDPSIGEASCIGIPPPKKAYEEAEMHGCEIHVSDRADFSFTARSDEAIARAVSPLV